MEQKISIVVPFYNVEKYANKCIKSIVDQTYKNLEIILVDDGSKDSSGKICDDWKNKDSRINVLHKENGGLSDARNFGLKYATGEYILFIDSDDFIEKNMIADMLKVANERNSDIVICDFVQIKEEEAPIFNKENQINVFTNIEAINELLLENTITNHAWNKLYKKELFENIEYPKGRNFEDIGTTYLLFEKSKKIVHIKNQYYAYVLRGNSITGKLSKKSLFDEIFLVNKRYNYLKEKFGNEVTKNLKINRLGLIIRYHMAVCKFLDKETFNSTDLQEEYKFFVNNYNEIGKLSNKQKILGKILYFNRNVFYLIMKFLYWMRGK